MIKQIFIGGCPRSGTTFLGDRLAALGVGTVTPESQFKIPVIKSYNSLGVRAAVETLMQQESYRWWSSHPSKNSLLGSSDLIDFFNRLVAAQARCSEIENGTWIDHTPINLDAAAQLASTFPAAKFIHIVRDGRAAFASVKNLDWGPNDAISGAEWWKARCSSGFAFSLVCPDRCMTVAFEQLVLGDLDSWRCILQFLAVPIEQIDLDSLAQERSAALPAHTKHQHSLVGLPPDKTRLAAWKQLLTPREIELFEFYDNGLLQNLGYETMINGSFPPTKFELFLHGRWPMRIGGGLLNRLRYKFRRWRMRSRLKSI